MSLATLLNLVTQFNQRQQGGQGDENAPAVPQGLGTAVAAHDQANTRRQGFPVESPGKRAARGKAQLEIMQSERAKLGPDNAAQQGALNKEMARTQGIVQKNTAAAGGPTNVPSNVTSDLDENEAAFQRGFNKATPYNQRRP